MITEAVMAGEFGLGKSFGLIGCDQLLTEVEDLANPVNAVH